MTRYTLAGNDRDDLLERMAAALGLHDRPGWVLVDPMQGVPKRFVEMVERAPRMSFGARRDLEPNFRPALLPLDERGQTDALDCALGQLPPQAELAGAGPFVGAWLSSKASPAEVADHLSRCAMQRDPRGQMRYVRWPDPRVFRGLWRVLDDAERASLLGPVDVWITIAAGPCGPSAMAARSTTGSARPWRPTAAQWACIDRMACVNIALARWRAEEPPAAQPNREACDVSPQDPNADDRDAADAAVRNAQALGLSERADLAAFAFHALRLGADFHRLAHHAAAIERARAERAPVDDAIFEAEMNAHDAVDPSCRA